MASFGPYHLTQTDGAVDADRAFLVAQLCQFNDQRSPSIVASAPILHSRSISSSAMIPAR